MTTSRNRKVTRDLVLRINILIFTYLFSIVLLIVRLFFIQVLNHEKYKTIAQEQYWDLSVLPAQRGDIISSDGFILAGTQVHYLLYVEPKKVIDNNLDALVDKLVTYKSFEEEEEFNDLTKHYKDRVFDILNSSLYWSVLARNVTPVQKEEIEGLNISGIGFEEEPVRYYPEGSLASHVLGFVASNEDGTEQGYFGIEGALDEDLKGRPGRVLQEIDAIGNPILLGNYRFSESIKGRDIILTMNRSVQYIVEKALEEGMKKYGAKSGTVIVMNPYTADIIAMANFPTYRPDDFSVVKEDERKNLAISQTYEPGSVMKPLTVASGIDRGIVTPDSTFVDGGPVNYSGYVIDNWDYKHHGVQTVAQLLEKSNNVGSAWLGHKIGSQILYEYLTKFGIGTKSKIELEGEDTGEIRPYKTWTDIDLATAAFGQGVSATPLQVLSAFNVFANGGNLLLPKITSEIVDYDRSIEMPTVIKERVISVKSADTMTQMLVRAAHYGEAQFFILKNYNIAGKTGTAQIPVDGRYDPRKTNVTFAGYLAGSKKFSMIVKLEEPQTSIYAAETAVPLWMDIADALIKYYGIPADR